MDFVAVVDQVIVLLRQRGRVTYRTLQRQFQLDENALADLLAELRYAYRAELLEEEPGGTGARCGPAMRRWPCRPLYNAMPRRCGAPRGSRCRCAWASIAAKWWCGPSATTCIWTTRPWARPPIWPPAWNSSPRRAVFC